MSSKGKKRRQKRAAARKRAEAAAAATEATESEAPVTDSSGDATSDAARAARPTVRGTDDGTAGDGLAPDALHPIPRKALDLLDKAYEMAVFAGGGALCSAWVVAARGGDARVQWVVGIIVMLAIVLARTVFAGDVSDIYEEAREKVEEDRRRDREELARGDFDGVPKVLQNVLKYPTDEELQQAYDESERQRGLLRDWEGRLGGRRKGKRDGDDGDSGE